MNWWTMVDIIMASLWILVYTLVIVSTVQTNRPAIAPWFPAIVVPWEIASTLNHISREFQFSYAFFVQLGFSALELVIAFLLFFRVKYFKKGTAIAYGIAIIVEVWLYLQFLFKINGAQLYLSYVVTITGDCLWLLFLLDHKIAHNQINRAVAFIKLIADILAWICYYRMSGMALKLMAYALVFVDIAYFIVYEYQSEYPDGKDDRASKIKRGEGQSNAS